MHPEDVRNEASQLWVCLELAVAQKFDQQTQVIAAVCVVLLLEVAHDLLCEIGVLVPEA